MHEALNQTLVIFGGKTYDEEGREKSPRNKEVGKTLVRNPAKLSSSIKQAGLAITLGASLTLCYTLKL